MKAIVVPVGTKFADSFAPVTQAEAASLVSDHGVGAVLRYADNLTAAELAALLEVPGLLVGLIVSAPEPNTPVSSALAQSKYGVAVERLVNLDTPSGASVIADFETFGGATGDRIAYCNAAGAVIKSASLDPASYFGAGVGLTSAQITDIVVDRYVKSLSQVRDAENNFVEPACGWCGYQVFPGNQKLSNGMLVDFGILGTDYEGRALTLIGP